MEDSLEPGLGCVIIAFALLCICGGSIFWSLMQERGHQEAEANRPEAVQARAWQQYLEAQEVAKEKGP